MKTDESMKQENSLKYEKPSTVKHESKDIVQGSMLYYTSLYYNSLYYTSLYYVSLYYSHGN